MKRAIVFGGMSVALLVLMALAAVMMSGMGSGGSAGGTLASGRSVTVHSDSLWLRCRFSSDTATIRTAGKTIVVAPTAVLIDGREVAPLDVGTKTVQVNAERGGVTLIADGATVHAMVR